MKFKTIKLLLFLMILFIAPLNVNAEGGDGSGSSSGQGKSMALTSVTLEDGTDAVNADNIPQTPKFTFQFDKNVVSQIYWLQNVDCFQLKDDAGEEVEITVTKIDDTVDSSKRQFIYVEPTELLKPGTTYTFYVSPELVAKNGSSTLGMSTDNKGEIFTFTTTNDGTVATEIGEQDTAENNGQDIVENGEQNVAADSEQTVTANEDKSSNTDSTNTVSTNTEQASQGTDTSVGNTVDTENAMSTDVSAQNNATSQINIQMIIVGIAIVLVIIWIVYEIWKKRGNKTTGEK